MAKKHIPLLAIVGATALYLASNTAKAAPKVNPPNNNNYDNLPIPPLPAEEVDSEDIIKPEPLPPLPDLPDLDSEEIPPPKGDLEQQGPIIVTPDMKQWFWQFLLTKPEAPINPTEQDLWISKTCESWGIGKQFTGKLPAKYVFENPEDPNKMISPMEWWSIIGKEFTPTPHYFAHLPNDLPYRTWARNLIQYYSGGSCGYNIPQRKDYKSYKDYDADLQKFEQTNIGKLYKTLYKLIASWLDTHWEKQYPDKETEEDLKYWALWAVRHFPKLSATNQTDEAYKKAFEKDPNKPKKIDPQNPKHQEYKDAWMFMHGNVLSYRNWIKQYGDFKDPLE